MYVLLLYVGAIFGEHGFDGFGIGGPLLRVSNPY